MVIIVCELVDISGISAGRGLGKKANRIIGLAFLLALAVLLLLWSLTAVKTKFRLASGVHVTDLSGISEGYSLQKVNGGYSVFTVNVSAERLEKTFLSLAELVRTPGFAVIEVPASLQYEKQVRKSESDPFHKDVYHLDGIDFERFRQLFLKHSQFFLEGGQIDFGFGSHQGNDEVFIGRYKIAYIYADTPEKYIQALEALGYERREPLKTVWNNFTAQTPGSTEMVTIDGKTICELAEELEREGFHLAERGER